MTLSLTTHLVSYKRAPYFSDSLLVWSQLPLPGMTGGSPTAHQKLYPEPRTPGYTHLASGNEPPCQAILVLSS